MACRLWCSRSRPRAPPTASTQPIWPQPQGYSGKVTPATCVLTTGPWPHSPANPPGARDKATVDHQPAAHACAKDDAKDGAMAAPCPVLRFGHGEAVGIVQHQNRQAEGGLQVRPQTQAIGARDIGHAQHMAVGVHHPGDGNGDAARLQTLGEMGDGGGKGREIGGGCGQVAQWA